VVLLVLLANTNPVVLKPAPTAAVDTPMTVMPSPGNSVGHHHPRVMWLPGNSVANNLVVTTTHPVAITETGMTMDLAAPVVPPLGLCRTRTRAATTAMALKVDTLLLVLLVLLLLPLRALLPGSNRLLLVDNLPMEHMAGMPLILLAWEPLVPPLPAWVRLLPLLVWLRCTVTDLLPALPLRHLLVRHHLLLLRVTSFLHLLLPSDAVIQ
jgi:hypothetical protein